MLEQKEGKNAFASLVDLANQSSPGANGIICLPYFSGERTPINDPFAKGVFFGLSLSNTRADMYRAVLEGIAYSIRDNIEAMKAIGEQPKRILAVGGGIKNDLLMQLISDICQCEQIVPQIDIGACWGDAWMAAYAMGDVSCLDEWYEVGKVVYPKADAIDFYNGQYRKYKALYHSTKSLMQAH